MLQINPWLGSYVNPEAHGAPKLPLGFTTSGICVLSVKLRAAVPVFPARSVWLAVKLCVPLVRPVGMKLQAPVISAIVVPSVVLPSLIVTAVLASPVVTGAKVRAAEILLATAVGGRGKRLG